MADIDDDTFDVEVDENEIADDNDDVELRPRVQTGSNKKKDDDPDYDDDDDSEAEEDDDVDGDDDDDDFDVEQEDEIFGDAKTNLDKQTMKMGIQQNFPQFSDDDDDDSEGENEDDKYLQKFESEISKNIIADWHPELKNCNYDEIDILSRVVRDATGTIIDPLHRTLPFITRYEKARILGERAKQLNSGARPFVEVDESIIDGYLIALKEFEEKKIPMIIKRPLPNGGCEYWKCKDLEVI
uniref:DNA-directed RNA polymerase n=1 Tax=viral metagenome TaxID=1070528 RepID=A0A6C0DQI6_9ZZZZ